MMFADDLVSVGGNWAEVNQRLDKWRLVLSKGAKN